MTIHNTFESDIVRNWDLLFRHDDGEAIAGQLIARENAASVSMRLIARLFELRLGLAFRRSFLPFGQDKTFGIALLTFKSCSRFLIDKIGALSSALTLKAQIPCESR